MSTPYYAKKHKELGLCRSCPKMLAEGSRIYCVYHKEKDRIQGKIREKRLAKRLKIELLEQYGKVCNCCRESTIQFLTIDHDEGKGNLHRKELFKHNVGGVHMYRWLKKNNYPKGYTVLCMNCNWATRYSKICPHKFRRDG